MHSAATGSKFFKYLFIAGDCRVEKRRPALLINVIPSNAGGLQQSRSYVLSALDLVCP